MIDIRHDKKRKKLIPVIESVVLVTFEDGSQNVLPLLDGFDNIPDHGSEEEAKLVRHMVSKVNAKKGEIFRINWDFTPKESHRAYYKLQKERNSATVQYKI